MVHFALIFTAPSNILLGFCLLCLRSFPTACNWQCQCSVQMCLFCPGESLGARVLCERCESWIEICVGTSHWAGCSRRSFDCGWWCGRPHHEQDSWVSMEICGFMGFLSLTLESLCCFLLGHLVLPQVAASLRYSAARPDSVCSCDCRKHPYLGTNTRRQNNSAWSSKQWGPEIDTELVGRFILRHLLWYTYIEWTWVCPRQGEKFMVLNHVAAEVSRITV